MKIPTTFSQLFENAIQGIFTINWVNIIDINLKLYFIVYIFCRSIHFLYCTNQITSFRNDFPVNKTWKISSFQLILYHIYFQYFKRLLLLVLWCYCTNIEKCFGVEKLNYTIIVGSTKPQMYMKFLIFNFNRENYKRDYGRNEQLNEKQQTIQKIKITGKNCITANTHLKSSWYTLLFFNVLLKYNLFS